MQEHIEDQTPEVNCDSILIAEYSYIVQTIQYTNEDRARASSYYFLVAGSVIAAILGLQSDFVNSRNIYVILSLLFCVLAAYGILIQLHLIKLRLAWFDSITAMNQIKNYYLKYSKADNLQDAFRWNSNIMPEVNKFNSISFILVLQIAFFGSTSLSMSCLFLGLFWEMWWLTIAIVIGVVFFFAQAFLYRRTLIKAKI